MNLLSVYHEYSSEITQIEWNSNWTFANSNTLLTADILKLQFKLNTILFIRINRMKRDLSGIP